MMTRIWTKMKAVVRSIEVLLVGFALAGIALTTSIMAQGCGTLANHEAEGHIQDYIAIGRAMLDEAERALAIYEQFTAFELQVSQERYQEELERRQHRVEMLRQHLDTLLNITPEQRAEIDATLARIRQIMAEYGEQSQ